MSFDLETLSAQSLTKGTLCMRYESDLSMENAIYDLPRCRKEEYKKDNSSINFPQWSRKTEYIVPRKTEDTGRNPQFSKFIHIILHLNLFVLIF